MCIICISPKGVEQPDFETLRLMYQNNPDGAGYMYARGGRVHICKGFMRWQDYRRAIYNEHFTADDVVVYHCRISTQAGRGPEMTHPFPLSRDEVALQSLDCTASVGIAHNGIITLTTDRREKTFSDTAIFIRDYLCYFIRSKKDLDDVITLRRIESMINGSRLAIMDGAGNVTRIGHFEEGLDGNLYSNSSYKPHKYYYDDLFLDDLTVEELIKKNQKKK